MAIPGPLKDEFFKYRKSKTKLTDGSVSGVSYNRFRSHLTHPLGSGNGRPSAGYHHDLYMHGNPGEYRPNINAPSVDWTDYETYEPLDVSHIPASSRPFHNFNTNSNASTILGIIPEDEQNVGTDVHIPKPSPEDIARRFIDLADALSCLQKTLPKEHPDVMNLRGAISEIINDPVSMSELETLAGNDRLSKLGSGNPYEVDMFEQAAKEYDLQIGLLENSVEQLSRFAQIGAIIEPDRFDSELLAGQQALDDVVANEDAALAVPEPAFMEADMIDAMPQPEEEMIADEINQAIDEIIEQPLPEEIEPDPWQMQYNQMAQMFNPNYMIPPGFGAMGPM